MADGDADVGGEEEVAYGDADVADRDADVGGGDADVGGEEEVSGNPTSRNSNSNIDRNGEMFVDSAIQTVRRIQNTE